MIKIIKQEIKISHELKSKVEWASKLNSTKPIFINGSLLKWEPTNIGYLEPHRAIINNKTWEYSINLEVFYNTSGSSFPVKDCDSK